MYKDELIRIHQLFTYVMRFLVENGAQKAHFEGYRALGVSPHHAHKVKDEHKRAIFSLASGISYVLAENDGTVPRSVGKKMVDLAKKCGRGRR